MQFCRNYLRHDLASLCEQSSLKVLYESGCGLYMYSCFPTIDLFGSFRLGTSEKFAPLLVSVKTRITFSCTEAANECSNMMTMLQKIGVTSGLCLLIVIGADEPGKVAESYKEINLLLSQDEVRNIGTEIVSKAIVLKTNDEFGISNIVLKTSLASQRAEVYSGHPFFRLAVPGNPKTALIRAHPDPGLKPYMTGLVDALAAMRLMGTPPPVVPALAVPARGNRWNKNRKRKKKKKNR
jgi:hypothetical protein